MWFITVLQLDIYLVLGLGLMVIKLGVFGDDDKAIIFSYQFITGDFNVCGLKFLSLFFLGPVWVVAV